MNKIYNPELVTLDNPEWTDEMFAQAKRVNELPLSLRQKITGGRPKLEQTKQSVTVRYDAEVLEYFRATGKGWQTRMNDALKEWIAAH